MKGERMVGGYLQEFGGEWYDKPAYFHVKNLYNDQSLSGLCEQQHWEDHINKAHGP